jgi:hypothetical protein
MLKVSRKYLAATICLDILAAVWLMLLAPATLPLPFVRGFDQDRRRCNMKYRIAIWGAAGFLVAFEWAVCFFLRNKELPIGPLVSTLVRLTCPIAIVGAHYPVSIYSALAANVATYALVGLVVEILRRQLKPLKLIQHNSKLQS